MSRHNGNIDDSDGLELDHRKDLFKNKDGDAIHFFMRPCKERARLRDLIVHGGGTLSSKYFKNSVKLVPDDCTIYNGECYSTRLIWDSVKENRRLDLKMYKRENLVTIDDNSDDASEDSDFCRVKTIPRLVSRRSEYSYTEDVEIIQYIIRRRDFGSFKGNAMWKTMESSKKLTKKRSWQSLKERFNKKILPNISSYNLTKEEIKLFKPSASDASQQRYTGCEDMKILKYIISRRLISQLRDFEMWKEMEVYKITSHTWQSMRDHFRRHIVPNLDRFNINSIHRHQIEREYGIQNSESDRSEEISRESSPTILSRGKQDRQRQNSSSSSSCRSKYKEKTATARKRRRVISSSSSEDDGPWRNEKSQHIAAFADGPSTSQHASHNVIRKNSVKSSRQTEAAERTKLAPSEDLTSSSSEGLRTLALKEIDTVLFQPSPIRDTPSVNAAQLNDLPVSLEWIQEMVDAASPPNLILDDIEETPLSAQALIADMASNCVESTSSQVTLEPIDQCTLLLSPVIRSSIAEVRDGPVPSCKPSGQSIRERVCSNTAADNQEHTEMPSEVGGSPATNLSALAKTDTPELLVTLAPMANRSKALGEQSIPKSSLRRPVVTFQDVPLMKSYEQSSSSSSSSSSAQMLTLSGQAIRMDTIIESAEIAIEHDVEQRHANSSSEAGTDTVCELEIQAETEVQPERTVEIPTRTEVHPGMEIVCLSESRVQSEAETKVDGETAEKQVQVYIEIEAPVESGAQAEPESEAPVETGAQVEPETEAEAQAEPESEAPVEPVAEAPVETGAQVEPETEAPAETGAQAEIENEHTEAEIEADNLAQDSDDDGVELRTDFDKENEMGQRDDSIVDVNKDSHSPGTLDYLSKWCERAENDYISWFYFADSEPSINSKGGTIGESDRHLLPLETVNPECRLTEIVNQRHSCTAKSSHSRESRHDGIVNSECPRRKVSRIDDNRAENRERSPSVSVCNDQLIVESTDPVSNESVDLESRVPTIVTNPSQRCCAAESAGPSRPSPNIEIDRDTELDLHPSSDATSNGSSQDKLRPVCVQKLLNGCTELLPDEHFKLLEWTGIRLRMNHEDLSKYIRGMVALDSDIFLDRIK